MKLAHSFPNPFLVITPEGYTKHYYVGTERNAEQIKLNTHQTPPQRINRLSAWGGK